MKRYPVLLTALMVTLAVMGFLLNATGSKGLAWSFVILYASVLIGWIVMAVQSGGSR